jgi:hypothetical protein
MRNMVLTSSEQVLEVTCLDCEHVGTLEMGVLSLV